MAKYNYPLIFIRGDGNCNPKNIPWSQVWQHFMHEYGLHRVIITHPTYHHFVGGGLFDSNIDIIVHTVADQVYEKVTAIICRNDRPDISSHHDIIMSEFTLPHQPPPLQQPDLIVAPRTM